MILLSIWQYIKDKQINQGIKLWVLADSSNGCTVDFKIYIGKDSARGISKFGLGHDVKPDSLDILPIVNGIFYL